MKLDVDTLTIKDIRAGLDAGDFSSVDLVKAYRKRIDEKNGNINALLEVFDDAIVEAKEADKRLAAGESLPLLGVPFGIKDNILIKGKRAGSASKILEGYVAPYDATVISKLKKEGAVFLGRANMDEFAMGGSTENSAYGVTKNPHDESRVAGGSSGGSAALVAMGGAPAALGSDTGGSVRQPASFCGLVGMKPTYGAVSRYGVMAMGSSLDQIGPFAKTVADAKTIFDAIRGKDRFDGTTFEEGAYSLPKEKKKYVIGVPRTFTNAKGVDPRVIKNLEDSVAVLKKAGMEIRDIELPNAKYALAVYYILMPAEASTNLARFDGMRFGARIEGDVLLGDYAKTRGTLFGPEVRRRIVLGTYVLSAGYYDAYYGKAEATRAVIKEDFKQIFESGVDAILTPTAPTPAFKIGEKANDPIEMYLADIFTVTANIVGVPAISVPSGFVDEGGKKLPLGMQFMSDWGRDDVLFRIAESFEKGQSQ